MTLVKSISVIQSLSVSWCSESFMKVQIIIWRSCQKVENSVLLWGLRVDQIWCQWKNEELHNDIYVEWNSTILRRILTGRYYFFSTLKGEWNEVLASILTPWQIAHTKCNPYPVFSLLNRWFPESHSFPFSVCFALHSKLKTSIELSLLVPSTILVLWQGYLCILYWNFICFLPSLFWVVSFHFSVSSNNIFRPILTHFNQCSQFWPI